MKKKDAAKSLYFEGHSQKEIARVLKLSERTISIWKNSDGWEEKRAESALARETAEDRVLDLINYQLWVLKLKKEKWLENYESSNDPNDLEMISKGDIDALQKLFTSIKKKEQSWTEYVKHLREFMDFLQEQAPKLATKELANEVDQFLNQKRNEL